ncbi:AraC family transcriptional regulator [Leucobacter luti]|uniref:AraC family transcriptional regulator n=1 Tax=Leucobacter luti TaxID=340320 RepID=A0A4Q7TY55_9MICO|nr:AraC family transcriptional regulator [Leucobacter luti]MBL3698764.1 AraC family transcriptional regulator [Leucobacter luti]RZT66141.1 AraC family transcriptional regulator [Leucobacter luti]
MGARAWAALPRAGELLTTRTAARAASIDEAHETVSGVFCDHTLAPLERREVRMSLRSVHDSGVGIDVLDYGEAVRIGVPGGLEDFHLVQIPLRGRATMEVGNAVVHSSPSVATVPPLDRGFVMRWDAGVPTLICYAARTRVRAVAQAVYGVDDERLQLGLHLQLDSTEGSDFLRALLEHHDVLERATADGAYARKLSSDLLLTRLLNAVDNSVSRSLGSWTSAEPVRVTPGDALVRRFEACVEDGAARGLGVLELAGLLGVPLRTLQSHVRAVRGTTPTALLREAQLRHARTLLEAADPQRETVTGIAQRAGFTHLGRFSIEYRRRFAESPAETLRR